jgi:hypothetical protein
MDAFLNQHPEVAWRRDPSIKGRTTWGGDSWCAHLMGKAASQPLTLDYTFIAGSARAITTQIMDVGYQGSKFTPRAGSDHALLFNVITV